MARLAISLAAAAAGFAIGGPTGAQIGFAIGTFAGAVLDPQKIQGPRLDDLKAPKASYGSTIPYCEGSPRVSGAPAWASEKREIATTSSVGGKGPTAEQTTYTYEIDAMYLLSINEGQGVRRIWDRGGLIWSIADTAEASTRQASAVTERWRDLRIYNGGPGQMPDPTYEAALGVGNAPAYRGRQTVFIEGLQLDGDQLPILTFELGSTAPDPQVILLLNHSRSGADLSSYDRGAGATSPALEDHIAFTERIVRVYRTFAQGSTARYWYSAGIEGALGPYDWTLECFFRLGDMEHTGTVMASYLFMSMGGAGALGHVPIWYDYDDSPSISRLRIDGFGFGNDVIAPLERWRRYHLAVQLVRRPGNDLMQVWLDGQLIGERDKNVAALGANLGGYRNNGGSLDARFSEVRLTRTARYSGASFRVPERLDDEEEGISSLRTPALSDVVSRLCLRTGLLTADDIDVTALAGVTVRGMAVSQVTSARVVLENLMRAYHFDCVEGEKLRFVMRGGSPAVTIPYEDLGAYQGGTAPEPLTLVRRNDLEMPGRVSVKFANMANDFQDGLEHGDRLTDSTYHEVAEIPLGLTPQEARRIADVRAMDIAVAALGVGPIALDNRYARLEPTDIVMLTGPDGSTYRTRITRTSDAAGLRQMEVELDDASVINSAAITDGSYSSNVNVRALENTEATLLDIPILRDGDNTPGFYASARPQSNAGRWPGAVLRRSIDGVDFSVESTRFTDRAISGVTTTTLGNWTGINGFDEYNTVTVTVPGGEFVSSTREAMLADLSINVIAIGAHGRWEIIRFRNAQLIGVNTYRLSGLLRGERGTEAHMGSHTSSDTVVLLRMTGLRRVSHLAAEIGLERTYRAITFGRTLESAPDIDFTDTGNALRPFAPVDLRAARDTDGDITFTWSRRTRMSYRFLTVGVEPPLGEQSEAYSVEVWDTDTYDNLVRTFTASAPTVEYSEADQIADFGSAQAVVHARVYQISATVGRGYPLEASA